MGLKVSFNIIDDNGNFSTVELPNEFFSTQDADDAIDSVTREFESNGSVVISVSTKVV